MEREKSDRDNKEKGGMSEPEATRLLDEPGETRSLGDFASEAVTMSLSTPGTTDTPDSADTTIPVDEWAPGTFLLDEFTVESKLGEGGMGAVYLIKRKWDNQLLAMKTLRPALLGNFANKRAFLRELRTWMDLPDHPHLTAFRFLRSIRNRCLIFSEYVSGGSLRDWIQSGRLSSIDRILDAAIQFCWGLHAAHVFGVVHQDVKPSNALMTDDGIVKITDFGLSRARQMGNIDFQAVAPGDQAKSILVSTGGMTPAYCSPEQANGEKIGRKTDQWSWGVSLLEMFVGEVRWRFGIAAPVVLEQIMNGDISSPVQPIPQAVAEILERCFREDPKDRWSNMLEISQALTDIFKELTGKPYRRAVPDFPEPVKTEVLDRSTTTFTGWRNPVYYLEKIFEFKGEDPKKVQDMIPQFEGSRKAQVLIDMELYDAAENMLQAYIASEPPNPEAMKLLVHLYLNRPWLYKVINDIPGTVHAFDRAIEICRWLSKKYNDDAFTDGIATAAMNKATVLENDVDESLACFSIAETIWSKQAAHSDLLGWQYSLGLVYFNRGTLFHRLGRYEKAIANFERCRAVFEAIESKDPDFPKGEMSLLYSSMSKVFMGLERKEEAGIYARKSVDTCRNAPESVRNDISVRHQYAASLQTYGLYLEDIGHWEEASAAYRKACRILEQFVKEAGRSDMQEMLARAYHKLANIPIHSVRIRARLYNRAIRLLSHLVHTESQQELFPILAEVRLDRAEFLSENGNLERAETDILEITKLFETNISSLKEPDRILIENRLSELRPIIRRDTSNGDPGT